MCMCVCLCKYHFICVLKYKQQTLNYCADLVLLMSVSNCNLNGKSHYIQNKLVEDRLDAYI